MNSLRAFVFALCVFILWSSPSFPQSGHGCLSYEPTVVKLTGTIISKTYPGPPEYQSIRDGDEPETYWLLSLRKPICVNKQEGEKYPDPAQKNVRRIQLVFHTEDAYKTYWRLLWKRVIATGTLYGADTIHHKTPVLLWVHTLKAAK